VQSSSGFNAGENALTIFAVLNTLSGKEINLQKPEGDLMSCVSVTFSV
jgi:hypothetical protein